jgi:hypothetical protein
VKHKLEVAMENTPSPRPVHKTWKPTVSGILNIVTAAGGLIVSLMLVGGAVVLSTGANWAGFNNADFYPMTASGVGVLLGVMAAIVFVFSVLIFAGGITALQRKRWGLALAASIISAITGGVLGILSIIFVAMSKDEFV